MNEGAPLKHVGKVLASNDLCGFTDLMEVASLRGESELGGIGGWKPVLKLFEDTFKADRGRGYELPEAKMIKHIYTKALESCEELEKLTKIAGGGKDGDKDAAGDKGKTKSKKDASKAVSTASIPNSEHRAYKDVLKESNDGEELEDQDEPAVTLVSKIYNHNERNLFADSIELDECMCQIKLEEHNAGKAEDDKIGSYSAKLAPTGDGSMGYTLVENKVPTFKWMTKEKMEKAINILDTACFGLGMSKKGAWKVHRNKVVAVAEDHNDMKGVEIKQTEKAIRGRIAYKFREHQDLEKAISEVYSGGVSSIADRLWRKVIEMPREKTDKGRRDEAKKKEEERQQKEHYRKIAEKAAKDAAGGGYKQGAGWQKPFYGEDYMGPGDFALSKFEQACKDCNVNLFPAGKKLCFEHNGLGSRATADGECPSGDDCFFVHECALTGCTKAGCKSLKSHPEVLNVVKAGKGKSKGKGKGKGGKSKGKGKGKGKGGRGYYGSPY